MRRRPRRSRWWRFGYPIAFVALALAIPALVFVGLRVILDSSDGQLVRRVTDPTEPGYEAVLEPTPTDLVVSVDDDRRSSTRLTILSLTSDGVGGVMTVPAGTVVPIGAGGLSLRYIHDNLGERGIREQPRQPPRPDVRRDPGGDRRRLGRPGRAGGPITVVNPDPVAGAQRHRAVPEGHRSSSRPTRCGRTSPGAGPRRATSTAWSASRRSGRAGWPRSARHGPVGPDHSHRERARPLPRRAERPIRSSTRPFRSP